MIYDQTAIQSSQTTYLDGGELYSTNGDYTQLKTTFLFTNVTSFMAGLCYFSSSTSAAMTWAFDVGTISTSGTYDFDAISILYWNYRYRTCPTGFQYFNESDNLCYNGCNLYYFPNSPLKTCDQCHYTCATCTSDTETSCTSCEASDFRMTGTNPNTCVCMPGYSNVGTRVCVQCDISCATCSSSTVCTSCNPPRTGSAGQCLCPVGQVSTGAGCGTCADALTGCLNCTASGSIVTCISCDLSKQLTLSGGACVCQSGYALDTVGPIPCIRCY